jgi:hypothetical protein
MKEKLCKEPPDDQFSDPLSFIHTTSDNEKDRQIFGWFMLQYVLGKWFVGNFADWSCKTICLYLSMWRSLLLLNDITWIDGDCDVLVAISAYNFNHLSLIVCMKVIWMKIWSRFGWNQKWLHQERHPSQIGYFLCFLWSYLLWIEVLEAENLLFFVPRHSYMLLMRIREHLQSIDEILDMSISCSCTEWGWVFKHQFLLKLISFFLFGLFI